MKLGDIKAIPLIVALLILLIATEPVHASENIITYSTTTTNFGGTTGNEKDGDDSTTIFYGDSGSVSFILDKAYIIDRIKFYHQVDENGVYSVKVDSDNDGSYDYTVADALQGQGICYGGSPSNCPDLWEWKEFNIPNITAYRIFYGTCCGNSVEVRLGEFEAYGVETTTPPQTTSPPQTTQPPTTSPPPSPGYGENIIPYSTTTASFGGTTGNEKDGDDSTTIFYGDSGSVSFILDKAYIIDRIKFYHQVDENGVYSVKVDSDNDGSYDYAVVDNIQGIGTCSGGDPSNCPNLWEWKEFAVSNVIAYGIRYETCCGNSVEVRLGEFEAYGVETTIPPETTTTIPLTTTPAPTTTAPPTTTPAPTTAAPPSTTPPSITGFITITSEPTGADVLFDGVLKGNTPLTIRALPVGVSHKIEVSKPGYYEEERIVSATTRGAQVSVKLEEMPTTKNVPHLTVSQTAVKAGIGVGEETLLDCAVLNDGDADAYEVKLTMEVASGLSTSFVMGASKAGGLVYWAKDVIKEGQAESATLRVTCQDVGQKFMPMKITYKDESGNKYTDDTSLSITCSEALAGEKEIDSDGDGWSNEQEIRAGTDPNSKDTDGDGIWDPKDDNPTDPNIPKPSACGPSAVILLALLPLVGTGLLRRKD